MNRTATQRTPQPGWPYRKRLALLVLFQVTFLVGAATAVFAAIRFRHLAFVSLAFAWFAVMNLGAYAAWPRFNLNEVDRVSYLKSFAFGIAATSFVAAATLVS
jgi:hypothetical protein